MASTSWIIWHLAHRLRMMLGRRARDRSRLLNDSDLLDRIQLSSMYVHTTLQ